MERDFWLERWREGRIGFHQDRVTPLLERHWDAIGAPAGCTVLVPLAGKTLDMDWFAARGHRVIGVELSQLAIRQFFSERGIEPDIAQDGNGIHHRAGPVDRGSIDLGSVDQGGIDLIMGDAFALDDALLAGCDAVYDRAALIALPTAMRRRYADDLYARLPPGCRGLLITLDYPQHEKAGPPFAVADTEVRALFEEAWQCDLLDRKDILADQPGFRDEGVTALTTSAWRLVRR